MWGTDQAASLEFNGMKQLVELIKRADTYRADTYKGNGIKKITSEEKKKINDQKYW